MTIYTVEEITTEVLTTSTDVHCKFSVCRKFTTASKLLDDWKENFKNLNPVPITDLAINETGFECSYKEHNYKILITTTKTLD